MVFWAIRQRVHLIDPLDVEQMHNLMARCYMVMTDSGGLQEEAPAMGKPVLVMRKETERPRGHCSRNCQSWPVYQRNLCWRSPMNFWITRKSMQKWQKPSTLTVTAMPASVSRTQSAGILSFRQKDRRTFARLNGLGEEAVT